MELREAINELFEMTDEQRHNIFGLADAEDVLNSYLMTTILKNIESFCEPKYGDVYLTKDDGSKLIILDNNYILHEVYKCPQKASLKLITEDCIKTGKNVADKLKGLFE